MEKKYDTNPLGAVPLDVEAVLDVEERELPDKLYLLGERVKEAFKKCHIYEDAVDYVGLTEDEQVELEANKYYWSEINQIEFEQKALLTDTLHKIINTGKNAERLTAVRMLGEIIYAERFGKGDKGGDANVEVKVYIPDNGRHADAKETS